MTQIYKTETDSQTERTDLGLPKGSTSWEGKYWEFGIRK